MSKPKLTPWFPADVEPVRVGCYRTRFSNEIGFGRFQYWDGDVWGVICYTAQDAYAYAGKESLANPNPTWRGLAKEPK